MGEFPGGSMVLQTSMILLCVAVLAAVVAAIRNARANLLIVSWVTLTSAVAATGELAVFQPPRVALVLLPTLAFVFLLAKKFGPQLAALPWGLLIGFQAFRIPVELIIHQAVLEGVAPPQLSWFPGWNQDLLTGISALLLAPVAHRLPKWALYGWNLMGLCLLCWVLAVAILSLPTPLQQFEQPNTWVAFFPYSGLPVVLVSTALLGHLVLFRKLKRDAD